MSDEVRLPRDIVEEMVEHCEAGRPNEACGALAVRDGEIVKVFRMTNIERSPMRYRFDPNEQFAVYKALAENGWDLGGVYHSHTRTPAYPSPTDVREAHEDVPHLIVSFEEHPPDVRAFRISKESWDAEEGEIIEVPVTIVE